MKRMAILAALSVAAAGIAATPAAAQANGQQAFGQCRACHTLIKGGRNGVGPNLYGVINRPAASVPGFNYSAALKASKLKWDEKTLDQFLAAPMKKVPGTRMPIGVADPAKRAALIGYLKTETAK